MKTSRHTRFPLIVFSVAALSGCGWERKVVFRAPSETALIEIQQPFPANGWGIRVLLEAKGQRKTIYTMRGDVFLDFADAAWSKDGETVAVFTCGTPFVRLAYNVATNNFVSFSNMEQTLAAHIRKEYKEYRPTVQDRADSATLEWACSQEGKNTFSSRYPNSAPR